MTQAIIAEMAGQDGAYLPQLPLDTDPSSCISLVAHDLEWSARGTDESAADTACGHKVVCVNPRHQRPAGVERLIGHATKARSQPGWVSKATLEFLHEMMVEADLQRNRQGLPY
jgi:GDP-D-mannose dehydratase